MGLRIQKLSTVGCYNRVFTLLSVCVLFAMTWTVSAQSNEVPAVREKISIDQGWQFMRYNEQQQPDTLFYELRPTVSNYDDAVVADTRAAINQTSERGHGLRAWILPTANPFIKDPAQHYKRPAGNPGEDFPFVLANFDDRNWQTVNLPHDWAITGDFYKGEHVPVGGGMGRLPIQGVAWYRRKIDITDSDKGKQLFLDIDGAMSYAIVWFNGHLVGGWPYGYNSFRLDLTPFVNFGGVNQLAIRLDNPPNSSRWYPGAGIYRDVWLVKTSSIHVDQYGSFVTTNHVSEASADIHLKINIKNQSEKDQTVKLVSTLYLLDSSGMITGNAIKDFPVQQLTVEKDSVGMSIAELKISHPKRWQPLPSSNQSRYGIITQVFDGNNKPVDQYTTRFGIRNIEYNPNQGLIINGQHIRIQGVNQHHDLGALGAAFNRSAAKRQLDLLKEMGCNAIRFAHNPPDPALLDMTDAMGFLVIDEINDCWQKGKTPLDFHLIFDDWHEADLRSFVRRDRNHPSIIQWSFGNEVGEQYTQEEGATLAMRLHEIVHEEDPTRPAAASMNYAKPLMPFPKVMDVLNLNYQGEGIRDGGAYAHLKGIRTSPLYDSFHQQFPDKMIISSETASALSTRGTFIFPVTKYNSAPASDSVGGDRDHLWVSAYGLYTAAFGASPDKVFKAQDQHPFVAGEFVWSGFDYLGEPTPYYDARSSYCGMIDLAGFKKDRFYLYQSRWRPDLPMAHILPHWTLPGREGKITPVHVYSTGDEAELFINGHSQGKIKKLPFTYRFRWDRAVYEPGTIKVITYKNGRVWATDELHTAGVPAALRLRTKQMAIDTSKKQLAFITLEVMDESGNIVPNADNLISFSLTGPGKILATDNGDPADLNTFASTSRHAFSGKALCIVAGACDSREKQGVIEITATAPGLREAVIMVQVKP